jgi:hypothetical protein
MHLPQDAPHREHVFEVYASGVETTGKCLESRARSPMPTHGGWPRLHGAEGFPATLAHAPYANTSGTLLSRCRLMGEEDPAFHRASVCLECE